MVSIFKEIISLSEKSNTMPGPRSDEIDDVINEPQV